MYDVVERYCWFLSNYKFAEVFIEPPLALPESANKRIFLSVVYFNLSYE